MDANMESGIFLRLKFLSNYLDQTSFLVLVEKRKKERKKKYEESLNKN